MGIRKLFYAKDDLGNTYFIDRITEKEKKWKFFCPHCGQEVIPRMGENNAWHFAHVGAVCWHLKKKKSLDEHRFENHNLDKFSEKTCDTLEIGECSTFQCPVCRTIGKKEFGIAWQGKIHLCKTCFNNLDMKTARELLMLSNENREKENKENREE